MLRICVVDGQGGGIGSVIVKKLRESLAERIEIIALGTNAIATAAMLKAGANRGATGENALVRTVSRADVVVGSLAIVMAHSMMGELTPAMAEAISGSSALKLLVPMTQERVQVVGVKAEPLPHLIEELVGLLKKEVS
jgi:hypothetical protein